ncbi:hypothetical protein [Ruminococcus albus]|uniref:Uncharacterized protein n=1 Tax=Ruminococcus albus (strain ATCC 27210 / DSM 20455 / JCM 14654 / NCDO 2250 / 7) TaxID=697329 RepID=E6UBQ3_RUMA7|nr:hypothetical protein [Ruminococcus albus]ADU20645.1 hypothetical protein Rumal_0083 [Ruminococcus albus 7 = DSM 20455]
MSVKKKIYYALCFGCFICGIILCYFSKINGKEMQNRLIMATIFVTTSYFMFPFISNEKKDRILISFCINVSVFLFSLAVGIKSLTYLFNNDTSNWIIDLFAALGILLMASDLAYIIISFIASFYSIVSGVIGKIVQSNVKGKYMTLKKVITASTALLATVTTSLAGFFALIKSAKSIM